MCLACDLIEQQVLQEEQLKEHAKERADEPTGEFTDELTDGLAQPASTVPQFTPMRRTVRASMTT